jgi:hypothetical protein
VGPTPPYPFNGYTRIAEGRKRKNRSTKLNWTPPTLPESPIQGDHSHTRGVQIA